MNKFIGIFFERVEEDDSTEGGFNNKQSKANDIFLKAIKILLWLLLSVIILTFLSIIVAVLLHPYI